MTRFGEYRMQLRSTALLALSIAVLCPCGFAQVFPSGGNGPLDGLSSRTIEHMVCLFNPTLSGTAKYDLIDEKKNAVIDTIDDEKGDLLDPPSGVPTEEDILDARELCFVIVWVHTRKKGAFSTPGSPDLSFNYHELCDSSDGELLHQVVHEGLHTGQGPHRPADGKLGRVKKEYEVIKRTLERFSRRVINGSLSGRRKRDAYNAAARSALFYRAMADNEARRVGPNDSNYDDLHSVRNCLIGLEVQALFGHLF